MVRILFILICCFPYVVSAQWVEDLTPQIYSYDQDEGFQKNNSSVKPSLVTIDKEKYAGLWVHVLGGPQSKVFQGETLLGELGADGLVKFWIDDLKGDNSNQAVITLVPNLSKPNDWQVLVIGQNYVREQNSSTSANIRRKNDRDALILVWFILVIAILLVYYGTPKFFGEYFSVSSIFSALQRDEAALKAPVLDRNNMAVMFLYGLALAAIGYVISFEAPGFESFFLRFGNEVPWWKLVLTWLFWATALTLFLVFKWILILGVASPFNLSTLKKIQFFNYVRLALFIFLPLSVVVVSWYIMFPLQGDILVRLVQVVLLLALIIRIIMLYIKTRRISTHRNVHLISYICATEIAPVAVVIKFFYSI